MPRDLFTQPLFSPKLIKSRFPAQPLPDAHRDAITQWAKELKGGLGLMKEEAIRPAFLQRFFVDILGYQLMGGAVWTLHHEATAAAGSADAALGTFTHGQRQTVAPFELKGPKTSNLDALMPGRYKSPVQQAWEYANDLPGSQFVLVSNCDEIRLYALGYGRAVYESWTAPELLDEARYASFVGLLSAQNLLSNATQDLLKANAAAEKDITLALYTDYKTLRQELIIGLHHLNPFVEFTELVAHSQKLIDRLLFIAFAESRGLLPHGSIQHAATYINPYTPLPLWTNFAALFKAVDVGNPYLKIPPYNGGLFAPDVALDSMTVSDKLVKSFTKLAGYDYAQEVSVTVLGRIFEQSISDLERIASAGDVSQFTLIATPTGSVSKTSVDGKRKRDGVVYTPDHITRFIVEQTVYPVIIERFFALQNEFYLDGAWRKPSKDEKDTTPKSVAPSNTTEYAFWLAWQLELGSIRVCDPACGSGAFLVAAFDVLKEAYTQLLFKLRELAPGELLIVDISHQILNSNLFGVDINAESIEITKLSLWLKTAEQGRKLAGLEANFYQGNSLVADSSIDPLAFDWLARLPGTPSTPDNAINSGAAHTHIHWSKGQNNTENEPKTDVLAIFEGFDVLLGNPPYVRQELFTDLKPYLQSHYAAYHGVADLYVYFYELGLNLLKPGGRLGFISSSSFFKSSSGEPLRRLLTTACQLEVLVDFGDWQVFEGVTTYPAVITAQKLVSGVAPNASRPAKFLQLTSAVADLSAFFEENRQTLDLAQLGNGQGAAAEWQLEGAEAAALRSKLTQGHPTLKEAVGSPLYGIKTGLNEAFVIDRATRDKLVYADIASEALFKPFLEGKDIKRWQVESEDRWLIFTQRGADISKFPHVLAYLEQFRSQLEPKPPGWKPTPAQREWPGRKAGSYKWFEIQDTVAYADDFLKPKIFWPEFSLVPNFAVDETGLYSTNKGFCVNSSAPHAVAALLNSKAIWFVVCGITSIIRGGFQQLRTQNIETLPIPASTPAQQAQLSDLAQAAAQAAGERLQTQRNFARRIHDLLPTPPPKGAQTTLGEALSRWWLLADFKAFQLEVTKRFKADIPLKDRNDWEQWFSAERTRIHQLSANLAAIEREIDGVVYPLFGLTPAEVALIERAVKR